MDHGVTQQVRQPPSILVVRLVAFAGFDLKGIGQIHLDAVLQDVEDRFPIRPRALHDHVRYGLFDEPIPQPL